MNYPLKENHGQHFRIATFSCGRFQITRITIVRIVGKNLDNINISSYSLFILRISDLVIHLRTLYSNDSFLYDFRSFIIGLMFIVIIPYLRVSTCVRFIWR